MMKDIRFRAWDKDEHILGRVRRITWVNRKISDVQIENFGLKKLDQIILMQYTGLKDKKGIEIFEGDIVKRTYLFDGSFGKTHIGEVVYDKEYARYFISKPQKYTEPKTEDIRNSLSERSTYEVIGNIYENSELLEE